MEKKRRGELVGSSSVYEDCADRDFSDPPLSMVLVRRDLTIASLAWVRCGGNSDEQADRQTGRREKQIHIEVHIIL